MDLMNSIILALHQEPRVEVDPSIGSRIELGHPTAYAFGIELFVPRGIKRVGEINAFAIPAHFYHLRSPGQLLVWILWMWRTADDPSDPHRTGLFRIERVGHIILEHFACAPACDIEKPVIERQVDICNQRRNSFEILEQWRQFRRLGGFRWDLD